jgi:hypothetical protein
MSRVNNMVYTRDNSLTLGVNEVFYLNTLESYKLGASEIFNMSSDNKVGFVELDADYDYDVIGNYKSIQ